MSQSLFLKEKTELSKWGPILARYFYVSDFKDAVFNSISGPYIGFRWPDTICLFNKDKMVWLNEADELKKAGREVFIHYIVNKNNFEKIRKQWNKDVNKLVKFEKTIDDTYLKEISDNELHDLWNKLYELIIFFWASIVPVELSVFGSIELLEEKINFIIKDKDEASFVIQSLITPEEISFHQQEEIDLSNAKDLERHARKYFWLVNSYNGSEELSLNFFEKRKKELNPDIKKLIEERIIGIKDKKKKIIKKYGLKADIKNIAIGLCRMADWQDEYKKHVLVYTHYKDLLLNETARRSKYSIDSLKNCSVIEIMQILEKRGASLILEKRTKVFGFFMNPLEKEIDSREAEIIWEDNVSEIS